ncbi:hypothetical protein J2X06_002945 [Lysobacter niastensis]|uniref:Mannitol operon repressor n=1 Tax=Lysobacter niastensis TaxID=380629 RepID=A0ABU1WDV2_9GAMM|nr:hypothetical protein [Lysobacter niastensis]MDR7135727.1 hypothetical protein [Lysobacter niastensis]
MSEASFNEEWQKRIKLIGDELKSESDRTAAIVGAAWVEDEITQSLKSYFDASDETWNQLFSSSQGGALSSFGAKIKLVHLLKMVDNQAKKDLVEISRIRNEFAHHISDRNSRTEKLTFSSDVVRKMCDKLTCNVPAGPMPPRTAFTVACAKLGADFHMLRVVGVKVADAGTVRADTRPQHPATQPASSSG